jgi:hypothetical protein
MCDFLDNFGIEGWMIFGNAAEELADEKQQREFEQDNFHEDEYDVDKDEDYS